MINPFKRKSRKNVSTTNEPGQTSRGVTREEPRPNPFRNEESRNEYFTRYVHKQVVTGRPVHVGALSEFPVMDWLGVQGWNDLLSKDFEVYQDLVRQFYSNFEVKTKSRKIVLDCYVKGVTFELTEKKIAEILEIRSSAARSRRTVTPSEAKIIILGEHAGVETNHATCLDLPTRLLMLIVDNCVRPTSGNFTRLTEVTAKIMHDVKFGSYANLGEIMIHHMAHVTCRATANLPYGMWLTPIFKHFGVNITDETIYKVSDSHWIGTRTLSSMGYERAYPSGWRKKQDQSNEPARRRRGEEEEDEEEGNESQEENETMEVEPMEPARRSTARAGRGRRVVQIRELQEEMRSTRAEVRAAREAQDDFQVEMRERQDKFHNEMWESHHSYYAAMDHRWSSVNDNMAEMSQFIRDYVASRPSEFPPPPPNED